MLDAFQVFTDTLRRQDCLVPTVRAFVSVLQLSLAEISLFFFFCTF